MKRLPVIIFLHCLLLLPTLKTGVASAQETASRLDALVAEALASNPELKASEARWQMFTQKARQAGTFDDPMLMLKIQNGLVRDPLAFDRDVMTQKVIGISQMLPFFGKRALARTSAEQEADAYRWEHEERRLELARMVKETWYRLYAVDRALERVERNLGNLGELVTLTETMYGVGKVPQQDVFKAQVEQSKMTEMRIALRQQRRSLEAALNGLLYRPAETPLPPVAEVEVTPLRQSAAELEALAEEHRPLLRSLAARVEKGRAARQLADKEYYPDFEVAFEYMQRDAAMEEPGYDMYSAGITFNLPVQRARRHAWAAAAAAETRMAGEELSMLRNEIRRSIADTLARLERSRTQADLYRTVILPQADGSLESASSSYRVGKADFMNVLDSRMALFNFERQYYEMVADHQMALAELEALVGTTLP
jgi:outer membrane protein TolC